MTYRHLRKQPTAAHARPAFDMDWCRAELAGADPHQRTVVRERLWPATYAWLRTSTPAYRDLPVDAALADLPTMTSRDLADNGDAYLADGLDTEVVLMSSGSTTGRVKLLHRALCEFALIEEFEHLTLPAPPAGGTLMQIAEIGHGLRVPQRSWRRHELLQIPLTAEAHLRLMCELLTDPAAGIAAINGHCTAVMFLTEWGQRNGFDLGASGVRSFYFGGSVFGHRSRERLEAAWHARVRDMFGMTEFHQGHAVACDECGAFHFGHGVVVETLVPGGTGPAAPGQYADLLLSHLLPLAQRQPLLRYRTGDLVRVGPWCAAAGEHGVEPVGRAEHCPVVADGGRWPAFAAAACLDAFPELYRKPMHLLSKGMSSDDIRNPRHNVTFPDGRPVVDVERRVDLTGAAERGLTAAVADALRQAVAQDWGRAADDVSPVRVRIHPTGTLLDYLPE